MRKIFRFMLVSVVGPALTVSGAATMAGGVNVCGRAPLARASYLTTSL